MKNTMGLMLLMVVGLTQAAPQISTNQVVSTVTTEEPTAPAAYQYSYKVSDEEAQTYLNKDETRDGDNVEGQYSYVDSTGALVTVTYTAGPEGYLEERNVQAGAVEMRNIPGAWTGPLAGVDDVVEVVAPVRAVPVRPAQPAVDQSALIQLIISQLQPSINSAVQSAISSTSSASRTVAR